MKHYKVQRVACPFDENTARIRSTDFRMLEKPTARTHWSFDESLRSARRARSRKPALTLDIAVAALRALAERNNVGG